MRHPELRLVLSSYGTQYVAPLSVCFSYCPQSSIESLTIQKNSLEERCETLESDNRRLVSENAVLRQKLAERPPQSVDASQVAVPDIARASEPVGVRAGDTIADALIVAIERHVSSSLDLSGINGNQLVKDLKGLGFEFRVRLVGAGT
jgi:hypothetical protein